MIVLHVSLTEVRLQQPSTRSPRNPSQPLLDLSSIDRLDCRLVKRHTFPDTHIEKVGNFSDRLVSHCP